MKSTHETESAESKAYVDDHNVFSPIEDLQKIEGVTPLKKNSYDLNNKPKAIRFIGYFIIAFFVISALILFIANVFYN